MKLPKLDRRYVHFIIIIAILLLAIDGVIFFLYADEVKVDASKLVEESIKIAITTFLAFLSLYAADVISKTNLELAVHGRLNTLASVLANSVNSLFIPDNKFSPSLKSIHLSAVGEANKIKKRFEHSLRQLDKSIHEAIELIYAGDHTLSSLILNHLNTLLDTRRAISVYLNDSSDEAYKSVLNSVNLLSQFVIKNS